MNRNKIEQFIENKPNNIDIKYKIIKVKKNQGITQRGNTIEKIYINIDGKLQVKNEFENGFIYNFAQVNSIAYIGAMEIMSDVFTYVSTLQAMTECTMVEMSISDFKKWIENDINLALEVLKIISKSMCQNSLNNGEALAYPAIYILINYLTRVYEDLDGETIEIVKSREEIGSTLGFSVRTINRNLKILKDEDLVTVSRSKISINKEQFKKLCNKLNTII